MRGATMISMRYLPGGRVVSAPSCHSQRGASTVSQCHHWSIREVRQRVIREAKCASRGARRAWRIYDAARETARASCGTYHAAHHSVDIAREAGREAERAARRAAVLAALHASGGDVSAAGRAMGTPKRTLWRWVSALDLRADIDAIRAAAASTAGLP